MGTWGTGSFDNDDARDWLAGLLESDDLLPLSEAIDPSAETEYLEADICACAIGAAEVLALLKGAGAPGVPEELRAWSVGKLPPDAAMTHRAIRVLDRILASSELKDLWAESDDFSAWERSVQELRLRLAQK